MARIRVGWIIIATIAVFCAAVGWYSLAADYDYRTLAGTYVFQRDGRSYTLKLYADRTFEEDFEIHGTVQVARGRWRRFGESGMALSGSFLKVPEQESGPAGENYGSFYKLFGVFPVLQLDSTSGGLRFHRKLISW